MSFYGFAQFPRHRTWRSQDTDEGENLAFLTSLTLWKRNWLVHAETSVMMELLLQIHLRLYLDVPLRPGRSERNTRSLTVYFVGDRCFSRSPHS